MELHEVLPPVECKYGVPARFDGGAPLVFPAFTVVFRGRAIGVGSLVRWVFEIRTLRDAFEAVATSGGDIEAAAFRVHDDAFALEIVATDAGPLQASELVVTRLAC